MRFSTVAFMAGSALAHGHDAPTSTDYTTTLVTVTACPSTVTNCPAHSQTSSVVTSLVPVTTSTVYTTKVHTITSCGPTVTNCPAHSTIITTETIPISTTVCPVGPTTSAGPVYPNSTIAVPTGGASSAQPSGPVTVSSALPSGPATTAAPECPSHSVTAITKSYTTVLTTVEYSTVEVPCPTETQGPSGTVTPPLSLLPCWQHLGPHWCPSPVTAGAASFAGSALFAAAAGVAAYVFA
ncbi:hypothetical protein ACCO45_001824 [Purpureocillium lilacinum]|uniref:Uncharacterized protein n=1 Tax=Purpureocillium lilacinum TaxID=33203 RepID=A0ACC4EAV6_PURLI